MTEIPKGKKGYSHKGWSRRLLSQSCLFFRIVFKGIGAIAIPLPKQIQIPYFHLPKSPKILFLSHCCLLAQGNTLIYLPLFDQNLEYMFLKCMIYCFLFLQDGIGFKFMVFVSMSRMFLDLPASFFYFPPLYFGFRLISVVNLVLFVFLIARTVFNLCFSHWISCSSYYRRKISWKSKLRICDSDCVSWFVNLWIWLGIQKQTRLDLGQECSSLKFCAFGFSNWSCDFDFVHMY